MGTESSPQSGEMFIATRLPLIISATSEMLSISLVAEEVRRPCTFYKHYVSTARFCPDSLERLLLRQSSKVERLPSQSYSTGIHRSRILDRGTTHYVLSELRSS